MTQARLETMKKAILFTAAAALILAAAAAVILYRPEPSRISIEQFWTDEKEEYVGAFGFDYYAGQVESQVFPVLLGADSRITVEELDGESSPCSLGLYLDREKLWWTPIEAGKEYRPEMKPGRYDLVLEMSNGTGRGFITVGN